MSEKYEKPNVKKLTAVEVVKSNPKIYWGVEALTYEAVNATIISALMEDNCEKLRVDKILDWQIISSDNNWFLLLKKDVYDLFNTTHWVPNGGGNDLRFEYFLKIVASDICVFEKNNLHEIKGKIDESLSLELTESFKGKTCIAYKLESA